MLANFYRKFKRNWQDHGFVAALGKSTTFLFKFAIEKKSYRLYKINLEKWQPVEIENEPFQFRLVEPEETDILEQIVNIEEWLDGLLLDKLKNGAICLVALQDRTVAGFNIVGFGKAEMPLINYQHQFRPLQAWSQQISVSKDFRRMGLAKKLRLNIFKILKERGTKKFYGGALASNTPSLKLAEKVGFSEFVEITYTKILFKKFWLFKRV